uniref:Uncharacterized protein n=1 Tax=Myotis myotis TaxID=51298 RepID=A0A7J7UPC7_MYOMY|nr:hypothetical protein mMyoMyo1_008546 [Myotis myotis]
MCLRLLRPPSNTRVRSPVRPQGPPAPPAFRFGTEGRRLCCRRSGSGGILWLPAPGTAQQHGHFPPEASLHIRVRRGASASPRGAGTGRAGRAHGRLLCSAGQPHAKDCVVLAQWFSTFLMPRPFNAVPHVVVTPNHKIIFVATS